MAYVMFLSAEILGGIILYLTYKGVFGLVTAFACLLVMLALSFHVLVRKPGTTSIRMACMTAALWLATIFSANLVLEFRSVAVTLAAAVFFFLAAATAGAGTYALAIEPKTGDLPE